MGEKFVTCSARSIGTVFVLKSPTYSLSPRAQKGNTLKGAPVFSQTSRAAQISFVEDSPLYNPTYPLLAGPLLTEPKYNHMGGCQNYGPSLGPYYNTAPNI